MFIFLRVLHQNLLSDFHHYATLNWQCSHSTIVHCCDWHIPYADMENLSHLNIHYHQDTLLDDPFSRDYVMKKRREIFLGSCVRWKVGQCEKRWRKYSCVAIVVILFCFVWIWMKAVSTKSIIGVFLCCMGRGEYWLLTVFRKAKFNVTSIRLVENSYLCQFCIGTDFPFIEASDNSKDALGIRMPISIPHLI